MVIKYTPEAGDIAWVQLSPTKGHEQSGIRPVVVLSYASFNKVSGLCTFVPITSKQKGYSNEVAVSSAKVKGMALVDQIRTIDYKIRKCRKEGEVMSDQLQEIRDKLRAILGIS